MEYKLIFQNLIHHFLFFLLNHHHQLISAFAFFASLILSSSQTTATLIDFPVPPGKFTTVLKLISFFFVYYLLKNLNLLTHQILLYNLI